MVQVTTLVFDSLTYKAKLTGKIISMANVTVSPLELSSLISFIRFALEKIYKPFGEIRNIQLVKIMKKLDQLEYGKIEDIIKAIEDDYSAISLKKDFDVTEYNFLIAYIVKMINNTLNDFNITLNQELLNENNRELLNIVSPNNKFLTLLA